MLLVKNYGTLKGYRARFFSLKSGIEYTGFSMVVIMPGGSWLFRKIISKSWRPKHERTNRNRCENIMCDRYSPVYGIFVMNVLKNSFRETNIKTFMESHKMIKVVNKEAALARFNVEFPIRE
jgi:hypothetical protein